MAEQLTTIYQLAKAINRDRKSARNWLSHDDWPFVRVPPWDAADVPKMLAWAAETLQPNRDPDARRRLASDGRPEHRDQCDCPYIDVISASDDLPDPYSVVGEYAHWPEPIVLPVERAILNGERMLTQAELRAYVLGVVVMKTDAFAFVGGELHRLVRQYRDTVEAVLLRFTHDGMEQLRDVVEEAMGTDAAGARPPWREWMRTHEYYQTAEGAIVPKHLKPIDPPPALIDEPLADLFQEHDGRLKPKRKRGG